MPQAGRYQAFCRSPLRLPYGCIWHRIRNQMELSFTTMAPIRRNDQTSSTPPTNRPQPTISPPPTNRPHHELTDRNATSQTKLAKPNRQYQPPTQTDEPPKPPPNTRCGPPRSSRDGPQPMLQHPPTSQPHAFIRIRTRIRRRIRYLAASAASAALAALTLA